MKPPSRQFEEAVYAFAKALDPSAKVLLDHKVPDRITRKMRQVDVWIEYAFGGHWPLRILVSCKRHKRKVGVREIETFRSEVESTGATTGVIYSKSGFAKSALEKAQAWCLACCRLYENEPAELPSALIFPNSYTYSVHFGFHTVDWPKHTTLTMWNDVFDLPVDTHKGRMTLIDVLAATYLDQQEEAKKRLLETRQFPAAYKVEYTLPESVDPTGKARPATLSRARNTGG